MEINDDILVNIYKNGTYYTPAWKHYGDVTNVVCDRCKNTQLDVSLGWNDYDLCTTCVSQISEMFKETEKVVHKPARKKILKKMRQRMFNA